MQRGAAVPPRPRLRPPRSDTGRSRRTSGPTTRPRTPAPRLQSLVSRLRAQLPDGVLESAPGGYRLEVARDESTSSGSRIWWPRRYPPTDDAAIGETARPRGAGDVGRSALDARRGLRLARARRSPKIARPRRRLADSAASTPAPSRARGPVPLTDLIGRETELAQLDEQLGRVASGDDPRARGGAGKTRLAMEAARARRAAYFVELAPVGPDEVWQAMLGAIGRDVRAVESRRRHPDRARTAIVGPARAARCCSCSTTASTWWMPRPMPPIDLLERGRRA